MKHLALTAVAGITLCGLATPVHSQTASARPDFAGVWEMDTTKFVKHDAALAALTLDVTHAGDTLVVTLKGTDVGKPPFSFVTKYDPTAIAWQGDTLVLHTAHTSLTNRTLDIVERWSVDQTGRTLTRSQSVDDLTAKRHSQQTLLFTRK